MYHAHPLSTRTASRHAAIHARAIEWEELPSLAELVRELVASQREGGYVAEFGSAWANTMPADLDTITPSQPFREPLCGLAIREVNEPEVFRHFFGSSARP
jgi:hypothetical protein